MNCTIHFELVICVFMCGGTVAVITGAGMVCEWMEKRWIVHIFYWTMYELFSSYDDSLYLSDSESFIFGCSAVALLFWAIPLSSLSLGPSGLGCVSRWWRAVQKHCPISSKSCVPICLPCVRESNHSGGLVVTCYVDSYYTSYNKKLLWGGMVQVR